MTDNNLHQTLENVLHHATNEEKQLLLTLVEGFERKRTGKNESYISSFLHIEKHLFEDRLEMTFPITPLTLNSLAIVHGGITATVLDTVMGTYASDLIPTDMVTVTSEMHLHFLSKGVGRQIRTVATCIHKGNTRLVMEGKAFKEDGTLMAIATGTFHVISRVPNHEF